MKLYYAKSACSIVVRIILNELNISFEAESVDLKAKKTENGANYLEINPKGAVPALQLNNKQVLTENQVILQYLADTTPNQTVLAAVGDLKRYQTLEWLNYISTELHKSLGLFYNPNVTEEMKTKVLLPLIKTRLTYINTNLEKSTYLMGEQFTLPDAYLFVMLRWAHYFKIELSSFTHLEAVMKQMRSQPSVIKSLKQES
jgi:glutathione S-transferase